MPEPTTPTPAVAEDELARWIDIDGLCRNALSDESQGDEALRDNRSYPGPIGAARHEPDQVDRRVELPEKVIKPKPGTKRKPLPRHTGLPEYSVICFPSNPSNPSGIKKKRRDFDERRRLEVAQVRKNGACFRCKMRRISVSPFPPASSSSAVAWVVG